MEKVPQPVRVRCRLSDQPLPAIRCGNVVAWDFRRAVPTAAAPDRTWLERSYLLLDVGVQLKLPHWWLDDDRGTWYVDLVRIDDAGSLITVRDLYLDAIVPTDGRPYRMLDIDEYGDALESGALTQADAIDGLRRWHHFLHTYLHVHGQRTTEPFWRDFPPACLQEFERHLAQTPA